MKSTYTLIGVEWDRMSVKDNIRFVEKVEFAQHVTKERNFFDVKEFPRYIELSELFRCRSQKQIDDLIKQIPECKVLLLHVGDETESGTEVVEHFVMHRLLQIYSFLEKSFPETTIEVWGDAIFYLRLCRYAQLIDIQICLT